MDHFLVFCDTTRPSAVRWWHHGSVCGPLCHCEAFCSIMVTPWTICWSVVSLRGLLQCDGDNMGYFEILCVITKPSTVHGNTMDYFMIFCLTVRPSAEHRWYHRPFCGLLCHSKTFHRTMVTPCPFNGTLCHHEAFWRMMVTSLTNFWSVVFRSTMVTPRTISSLLCHCKVFCSRMVTPWSIFWSFLLPRVLLQHDGHIMDHFEFVVTARTSAACWWHHGPFRVCCVTVRTSAARWTI